MRDTKREREAEAEAGSMQRARCGTLSRDSRITPWAKGRCPTAEPPRRPLTFLVFESQNLVAGINQLPTMPPDCRAGWGSESTHSGLSGVSEVSVSNGFPLELA